MSSTSSDPDRETEITLYNPSSEEAEELEPGSFDQNVLDIEIDQSLAERLLEVSQHLGLNPTIVASRAIDLVCEEIGTLDEDWRDDEDEFGTVTLIQRYQARVDLLQALKEESDEISTPEPDPVDNREQPTSSETDSDAASDEEEEELWEAVDQIKDVLDEVDEAVDASDDRSTSDEDLRIKEDESPPTEELAVDKANLEEQETEQEEGADESNRLSTVARIMNVFSNSDQEEDDQASAEEQEAAEEVSTDPSVPTEEETVSKTEESFPERNQAEPQSDASVDLKEPSTEEFTVDEAAMQEGTLEEREDEGQTDSEEDVTRSKDWDAVESIIEQGEQARG